MYESNLVIQNAPNTGRWGGTCKCPNGEVYQVADNDDACSSLACVGGVSGTCGEKNSGGEHVKVICGTKSIIFY